MAISAGTGAALFAVCAAQTHAIVEIVKARIPRRFILLPPRFIADFAARGIVSLLREVVRQYFVSCGEPLRKLPALEITRNYFCATLDRRRGCCMIMQCYA
jgi:hypothetical protein